MAASDNVPILLKNRLHLAGRPQMSTRPNYRDILGREDCLGTAIRMSSEELEGSTSDVRSGLARGRLHSVGHATEGLRARMPCALHAMSAKKKAAGRRPFSVADGPHDVRAQGTR